MYMLRFGRDDGGSAMIELIMDGVFVLMVWGLGFGVGIYVARGWCWFLGCDCVCVCCDWIGIW